MFAENLKTLRKAKGLSQDAYYAERVHRDRAKWCIDSASMLRVDRGNGA